MKPEELIKSCQEQIDIVGENANKTLLMKGKWGSRNYRTLFGVKGEIIAENYNGTITIIFSAKELMQAVQKEMGKEVQNSWLLSKF